MTEKTKGKRGPRKTPLAGKVQKGNIKKHVKASMKSHARGQEMEQRAQGNAKASKEFMSGKHVKETGGVLGSLAIGGITKAASSVQKVHAKVSRAAGKAALEDIKPTKTKPPRPKNKRITASKKKSK